MMELVFQFTLLVVGLILLWKMGELCVRNALGFSSLYGIHQFTVGFLIFAISTGFPEISSAIMSTFTGVPELSVGDLLGSSFVNMSLILGIIAVVGKNLAIAPPLRKNLFKVLALISLIVIWFLIDQTGNVITAFILIALYIGSAFWFQLGISKEEAKEEIGEIEEAMEKEEKKAFLSPKLDILFKLFGSLALLLLSSWITVHAATQIATLMGVNLALLGGTLIAIGTSFPELVLEIHAIRRKEYALALGDLFGSRLLNISFILGLLMLFNKELDLSYVWHILPFIGAILIWTTFALFRKREISWKDGIVFLGVFTAYMGYSAYSHFLG